MTGKRPHPEPGKGPDPRGEPDATPTDCPAQADGSPSTRPAKSSYHPKPSSRPAPPKVLPAAVAPMSLEDYEQAVTAIATMIDRWWAHHRARNE